MFSFQIVDRIRRQPQMSCEFSTHRRRYRDSTRQLNRVGVGGVCWTFSRRGTVEGQFCEYLMGALICLERIPVSSYALLYALLMPELIRPMIQGYSILA